MGIRWLRLLSPRTGDRPTLWQTRTKQKKGDASWEEGTRENGISGRHEHACKNSHGCANTDCPCHPRMPVSHQEMGNT